MQSLPALEPEHEEMLWFYLYFAHMNSKAKRKVFYKQLKQKFLNCSQAELQQLAADFRGLKRRLEARPAGDEDPELGTDSCASSGKEDSSRASGNSQTQKDSSSGSSVEDSKAGEADTEDSPGPAKWGPRARPEGGAGPSKKGFYKGGKQGRASNPIGAVEEDSAGTAGENARGKGKSPRQAPRNKRRSLGLLQVGFDQQGPSSGSREVYNKIQMIVQSMAKPCQNGLGHPAQKLAPKARPMAKPKGITNIGNTCYSSCILQILFHQPRFLKKIAKFAAAEEKRGKYLRRMAEPAGLSAEKKRKYGLALRGARFVESLQRFFKQMLVGRSEWVSPADVFAAMVSADNARMFSVGVQEDVVEFLGAAFQLIEAGFRLDRQVGSPVLQGPVADAQLLPGPLQDLPDELPHEGNPQSKRSGLQPYNCERDPRQPGRGHEAGAGLRHRGLRAQSGRLTQGQRIRVSKSYFIAKKPRVLMFQINRVEFAGGFQATRKNNQDFKIPESVDLTEFRLRNKDAANYKELFEDKKAAGGPAGRGRH